MTRPPGRPSVIDEGDNVKQVAELYAAGASRQQIADVFGVHKDTISDWTKRPDVQALVSQIRQQKTNRILRVIDNAVLGRIENEEAVRKMDMKDLLAIKREYTPQRLEVGKAGDFEAQAELAMWDALDRGDEAPVGLPEPITEAEVVEDEELGE